MIGIIGAMEIEVEAILNTMNNVKEVKHSNTTCFIGKLKGKDVVVALSGVGKVKAAMTTTILISQYAPQYIINVGTAGAMLEEQGVLDVVVSNELIQHDFDTSGLDGNVGYGIRSYCDDELITLSEKLLQGHEHKVWVGGIATGDQFIYEITKVNKIKQRFPQVIACEMEAASIAFVCNALEVKCIVIRSLSDNPYHPESHMEFMEYAKAASVRSAVFCEKLVASL